jgi:hypothetical protein
VIDKALQLTKDAGMFYEKNKYRSYWCIPVREHYLLEFNLDGKYYYYDAQGREEDNRPAPFIEPIPQCMSEMEALSRRLSYLPKMKSQQVATAHEISAEATAQQNNTAVTTTSNANQHPA